jgi:hypothetical protein
MQHTIKILFVLATMTLAAACGRADVEAPAVTFTPDNDIVGKPSGPIAVSYRIIGKPVVGQPVAIELKFDSSLGDQPVNVAYRITDATAMRLADSQPAALTVAPAEDNAGNSQRVTVIPMREGRLYLNVSASVDTAEGSMGTVTAIPLQVGNAPRAVQENGTAETDENGEAIRALPAQE